MGDIGWALSMLAFTGVLVVAPIVQAYYFGRSEDLGTIWKTVIESVSALVLTAPYIAHTFGSVSVVALGANILVTPLVPFVMLCTALLGVLADIPIVSDVLSYITRGAIEYILAVVKFFSDQDPGLEIAPIHVWVMVALYVCIALFVLWMSRASRGVDILAKNSLDD